MKRCLLPIVVAFAVTACTTTQEVRRPDGSAEYLIACGSSTGWNICYQRANEVCPGGWETLAEMPGFNRKEMRVRCSGA